MTAFIEQLKRARERVHALRPLAPAAGTPAQQYWIRRRGADQHPDHLRRVGGAAARSQLRGLPPLGEANPTSIF
jgi:hypothetical protein